MACQRMGVLFGHEQSFETSGASLVGLGITTLFIMCQPPALIVAFLSTKGMLWSLS